MAIGSEWQCQEGRSAALLLLMEKLRRFTSVLHALALRRQEWDQVKEIRSVSILLRPSTKSTIMENGRWECCPHLIDPKRIILQAISSDCPSNSPSSSPSSQPSPTPLLENDSECDEDSDCLSGRCDRKGPFNANRVCKARKENNKNCSEDSDCLSGRCDRKGAFNVCKPKKGMYKPSRTVLDWTCNRLRAAWWTTLHSSGEVQCNIWRRYEYLSVGEPYLSVYSGNEVNGVNTWYIVDINKCVC